MKSAEEILRFVLDREKTIVEHPRGFAESPQTLEGLLFQLDEIVTFALSSAYDKGYLSYLIKMGYDSNTYSNYHRNDWADPLEGLSAVASFFKDYLASECAPDKDLTL